MERAGSLSLSVEEFADRLQVYVHIMLKIGGAEDMAIDLVMLGIPKFFKIVSHGLCTLSL